MDNKKKMDKKIEFDQILWDHSGPGIEQESFKRIDDEIGTHNFSEEEWHVARRLIHTTADFSIVDTLQFRNNPIVAILTAIRSGALIYSDSNMIKSGISVAKLQKFNPNYTRDSIHCYIADEDVAELAKKRHITRALASIEKADTRLEGAIVLIGNAPLALARLIKLYVDKGIRPAAIIGMPVGFVNVVESKELLAQTDIPHIVIEGRRGGSPLSVATLHGAMENGKELNS
jgi:precorrin isomerase